MRSKIGRCRITTLRQNKSFCYNSHSGFTLIELLVVVLIIGILAAVAVPQYQKAVEKARLATLIPLVKDIANAKSEHYLATGEWARTFDVLSIDVPAGCIITDSGYYGQNAYCSHDIILHLDEFGVTMGELPLSDGSLVLYFISPTELSSSTQCLGTQNKRADQLCKSLPGATPSGTSTGSGNVYNVYDIN